MGDLPRSFQQLRGKRRKKEERGRVEKGVGKESERERREEKNAAGAYSEKDTHVHTGALAKKTLVEERWTLLWFPRCPQHLYPYKALNL